NSSADFFLINPKNALPSALASSCHGDASRQSEGPDGGGYLGVARARGTGPRAQSSDRARLSYALCQALRRLREHHARDLARGKCLAGRTPDREIRKAAHPSPDGGK